MLKLWVIIGIQWNWHFKWIQIISRSGISQLVDGQSMLEKTHEL